MNHYAKYLGHGSFRLTVLMGHRHSRLTYMADKAVGKSRKQFKIDEATKVKRSKIMDAERQSWDTRYVITVERTAMRS